MTAEVGAARHSLSVADLATWVRRSAALIAEHAEELTDLDAAIGDADHGTNMKRGLAAAAEAAQARRSQVRTVDRSERIRTYNFPENRIADHRTGFKAYNLDAVLDGDLGPVIASAIAMDEAERLSQVGEGSGS